MCLVSGSEEHVGYIDFWIHNFQDLYAYTCIVNTMCPCTTCEFMTVGGNTMGSQKIWSTQGLCSGTLDTDLLKVPYFPQCLRMARVEDYQYLSREREETGTHLTGRGWTATTGSNERGPEKGEWANKGTGVAHMPASVVWGEEEELEDQRSYEWLSIGRRSLLDFVLRSINFLNWRRNPTDRVERNPGDFVQSKRPCYNMIGRNGWRVQTKRIHSHFRFFPYRLFLYLSHVSWSSYHWWLLSVD